MKDSMRKLASATTERVLLESTRTSRSSPRKWSRRTWRIPRSAPGSSTKFGGTTGRPSASSACRGRNAS